MKKYISKEDIKTYLKWGPMEFDFKKAMLLYFILEFPVYTIIYWLCYFIKLKLS